MFDRPRGCCAFRSWRPPKSLISPSSGELSPRRDASPVIRRRRPVSQTYHRRLRLLQVEQERTVTLFFIPPEPLCSSCFAVGGKKRASRRLERKRNATATLGPLSFFKRRQRGSLTARSWVVTACSTLREKLNNAFSHSPGGFLLQSQRAAPRRVCGRGPGCCNSLLAEFKPACFCNLSLFPA